MTIRHYTGFSLKMAITTAACALAVTLGISACSDSDTAPEEQAQSAPTVAPEADLSLDTVLDNLNEQLDKASDHVQEAVGPHADQLQSKTKEEVEKLFRWEYKVMDLPANVTAEQMESRLSQVGEDGWECSSIVSVPNAFRVTCKRKPPSALAYLKYIPGL